MRSSLAKNSALHCFCLWHARLRFPISIQKNMTPEGVNFFGGDDGNRTRVRKEFAGIFSERSRYFRSPPPYRLTTGYTGRQLLMCDGERSRSLFTFTSDRRPLRGRGTPRRDGLHQAAILTVFLSVIFKFTDFMAVPHRRSLIRGRSPRRNLYIPIY